MKYDTEKQKDLFVSECKRLIEKKAFVEMEESFDDRTVTQNAAMHKYFRLCSFRLNELGITYPLTLGSIVLELHYTPFLFKKKIWTDVQLVMYGKESTTELNTKQVNSVYDVVSQSLATIGIDIPFPSIEQVAK